MVEDATFGITFIHYAGWVLRNKIVSFFAEACIEIVPYEIFIFGFGDGARSV